MSNLENQPDSEAVQNWENLEVRQRGEKERVLETPNVSLSADDQGADADLPRSPREERQRRRRRSQLSTALPALLLIGYGVLALLTPELAAPTLMALVATGSLILALLLRFLFNARRERGLFFVAVTVMLIAGFGALVLNETINPIEFYPVLLMIPGFAMLLTYLFERSHDGSLVLPGMALMGAGAALLPFTLGIFDPALLGIIAAYYPVLLLIGILVLLPRAIRDRAE